VLKSSVLLENFLLVEHVLKEGLALGRSHGRGAHISSDLVEHFNRFLLSLSFATNQQGIISYSCYLL
jgi:hypothetical protein